MIPFITCEVSVRPHACELVFGVSVFDLDFGVQMDSIEQPIKNNSVGSGNMSHCRTSSLYDHLDHCFVVFKHIQQSFLMRRLDVWRNKINIIQIVDHSLRLLAPVIRMMQTTGLPFYHGSELCFQGLKRSDPINQEREYHPTSILRPRKWFLILLNCAKLKFVSCTSNWLERMTSQNAQCSTHSRFWVLKISCTIGVLRQSQSALFGSVPTWQYCPYSHVWWM